VPNSRPTDLRQSGSERFGVTTQNVVADVAIRRAVLFPIAPVGVGTGMVESTESYVGRLAQAHGVGRTTLHRFINERGPAIYRELRGQPPRLDAPTLQAAAYMRRLAELTGQAGAADLGLSWLVGRTRAQHVFKATRAWCPDCLFQMRGGDSYVPLIWSLAGASCCLQHRRQLVDRCPHCGRASSYQRSAAIHADKCASCDGNLATAGGPGDEVNMSPIEMAVLEQLRMLVSTVASRKCGVRMPTFGEIVKALHRLGHPVGPREMSRRMGVSKGTLSSLLRGRGEPGIDLLVRMSTAYALPLLDLIGMNSNGECWLKERALSEPVVWLTREKPRIDWVSTQRKLDLELSSETARPVAQVAAKLNLDARHLAVRQPDRAAAVLRKYQARLGRDQAQAIENLGAQIVALKEWPSQRAVARQMGVPRNARRFELAWRSQRDVGARTIGGGE